MRNVFQSYDGLIFENEEECVEYERKHPPLEMYGLNGRTENPDEAFVVIINDKSGAESFISMCEEENSPCYGITEVLTGVFAWGYNHLNATSSYIRLDDKAVKAMENYLASKE